MPHRIEKRASAAFPADEGETFTVRDGKGRAVERWTAVRVSEGKTHKFITFDIEGFREVGAL